MGSVAATRPLVIFALDASDFDLLTTWADEGELPTLRGLLERGCWARTVGPELISEHGIWVSLLSGLSRRQHGYHYFRQQTLGTYDLQTVTPLDLPVQPFWGHLQRRGARVAILDAPDCHPVAGLDGLQFANWSAYNNWNPYHPAHAPAAEPVALLNEVESIFGPRMVIREQHTASVADDRAIVRGLLARIRKTGSLYRRLLARGRFDLMVMGFFELHPASHQLWRYRAEAVAAGLAPPAADLHGALRDLYRAVDEEIGALLADLPPDATVAVVGSAGLDDYYPTEGLAEDFCRQLGYQAPAALPRSPLEVARRLLPEAWRIALSRRFLSHDAREQLLAERFKHATDWDRTTAFAVPSHYTSFIRVNQRGREPRGIVAPGAETEALLDRIQADLRLLVDPATGRPAVQQVVRTGVAFGPDPSVALPDLFVEWAPGRFLEQVTHPRTTLRQAKPDFFRPSDHVKYGFVGLAGPAIERRGAVGDVNLLDLAPTFLALLGQPLLAEMSGTVLPVLTAGVVERAG